MTDAKVIGYSNGIKKISSHSSQKGWLLSMVLAVIGDGEEWWWR